MSTLGDRVKEIQREVDLLDGPYQIAVARESGEDEEWEEKKAILIRRICDLSLKYNIGDEPHKAVGICAQIRVFAGELRAPALIIDQYKEKKALLQMAYADLERQESTEHQGKAWRDAVGV